jgi:transposase
MAKGITWVGLDAHKKSISVAMFRPDAEAPEEWQVANREQDVRRLARKLVRAADGGEVRCCYEAGPCGYALQRRLEAAAPLVCAVIAPSLIPVRPGDRVKTDRRDARKLGRLFRAGELTEVHPPTEQEEAVRDLMRCREDAKEDLLRARHRLGKMLLRRGRIYGDGRAWTQRHCSWLRSQSWEHAAERVVFEDYLRAIELLEERLAGLDAQVGAMAGEAPYREPVGWLRCFHGIDTVTAMTIVAELHDLRRFKTAPELMSYVGLVCSEWTSADRPRRGRMTKAGNAHVRRVLIETAWHYRHRPGVGATLRRRRQGQPAWAMTLADKAHARLHRRYWGLVAKGKPPVVAAGAVARELVGFLWGVFQEGSRRLETPIPQETAR